MQREDPSNTDARLQAKVLKLRHEILQNELEEAKRRHERIQQNANALPPDSKKMPPGGA